MGSEMCIRDRTVSFENAPFKAKKISLHFDDVANRTTMDWYSGLPQVMPLGVLEISGIPFRTEILDDFDSGCRTDLLNINNSPVSIRVTGKVSEVLKLETCDGSLIELEAGDQTLLTTAGFLTGFDIDRVLLSSNPLNFEKNAVRVVPEILSSTSSRTKVNLSISAIFSNIVSFFIFKTKYYFQIKKMLV